MRVLTRWIVLLTFALHVSVAEAKRSPLQPPVSFVLNGLCIHAGRHFTAARQRGRPEYLLWGHGYWFAHSYDDMPAGYTGNQGEGPWPGVVGGLYGGGLSFMVGTWNRAAALSRGAVPYVRSSYGIASQSVATQLYAMWLIVQQDGGSFREWPQTGPACGAPT